MLHLKMQFAIEAADEAMLDSMEEADEADEWDGYDSEVSRRYDSISDNNSGDEK